MEKQSYARFKFTKFKFTITNKEISYATFEVFEDLLNNNPDQDLRKNMHRKRHGRMRVRSVFSNSSVSSGSLIPFYVSLCIGINDNDRWDHSDCLPCNEAYVWTVPMTNKKTW